MEFVIPHDFFLGHSCISSRSHFLQPMLVHHGPKKDQPPKLNVRPEQVKLISCAREMLPLKRNLYWWTSSPNLHKTRQTRPSLVKTTNSIQQKKSFRRQKSGYFSKDGKMYHPNSIPTINSLRCAALLLFLIPGKDLQNAKNSLCRHPIGIWIKKLTKALENSPNQSPPSFWSPRSPPDPCCAPSAHRNVACFSWMWIDQKKAQQETISNLI